MYAGCEHTVELRRVLDISAHTHHTARSYIHRGARGHVHSVDGIHHNRERRQAERHGRIAEQRVLQVVHHLHVAVCLDTVLCQALCLTDGHGFPVGHGEHIGKEVCVHRLVV